MAQNTEFPRTCAYAAAGGGGGVVYGLQSEGCLSNTPS